MGPAMVIDVMQRIERQVLGEEQCEPVPVRVSDRFKEGEIVKPDQYAHVSGAEQQIDAAVEQHQHRVH